ncbi:MAG: CDP-diacylglycerol--glycerol-3-phosphate 3-phosphatidyltransferase [Clostridiales bacterium]|jgi:CDP-diacylglycerol--glycerol-3-phosphate 3-phosphatidyltransferase|nr:CDP-diacylglycerol--glycerol-3-phosphate 3-phosphatidyltransferase [Clostridiales bacterium]
MKITANKITMARIALVPFIILFIFLTTEKFFYAPYIAFLIYLLAVCTDALDGNFARKTNTVSNFGKFLDPISDKIFVNGVLIALIFCGVFAGEVYGAGGALTCVNAACIIVMLTREFAISAIRQLAAEKNVIIAADVYGKIKAVLTFISFGSFILALAKDGGEPLNVISELFMFFGLVVFYAATAFSVLSGINYYLKNKSSLKF